MGIVSGRIDPGRSELSSAETMPSGDEIRAVCRIVGIRPSGSIP